MSDFPSINDLISSGSPAGVPKKSNSTSAGPAQLQQKMQQILVKEKEELVAKKAQELGVPYIDLHAFPVSSEALRMIPQTEAGARQTVCFFSTPEEIRLGTVELTDTVKELAYQLGERHHAQVGIYLVSEHSLDYVLALYGRLPVVKPVTKDIEITDEQLAKFGGQLSGIQSLSSQLESVSISEILTLMVAASLKFNSSDIHVEAEESGIAVRYRIDGILHDIAVLPKEKWKQFISRIKLLAALKINVTDRPQDGRVTIRLSKESIDVRVSTMPTIYGESVVMRILRSGAVGVTFDDLGLRGEAYAQLKREIERPNGMIVTTGPTGSGKTTSMYAILRTLNKPGVKIITLEDPIEIRLEGINQSQVDPSHDYTFAKGLRSILRQDPDICMVGEIRDLETAEIAIQAALTGHLMLSTIHTNSASGAIPRFLSMGVKPFLLAPALNSVIGQRLVRRICERCLVEDVLDDDRRKRADDILRALPEDEKKKIDLQNLHFYKGKGCEECNGLGYKGRIGIYEIFVMNKEIEAVILSGQVSEYTIQELAVKNGMVTMAQDGLLKALDKITTVDEVFRVSE